MDNTLISYFQSFIIVFTEILNETEDWVEKNNMKTQDGGQNGC